MQLNDSEWKVMRRLWERGRGGVADLHEDLAAETGWAYSTVKTLLERLVEKGAVAIEKARSGRVFVPLLAESEARGSAFRALLDRAFGGRVDAFAQHLVEGRTLSQREREELAEILGAEEDAAPPADPSSKGGRHD
ncbi:MAG TPA: BlaI/MecI/CopY family transcriptional regulator [Thermoanaerobaculia bacterium]|nr:BlaI/MecI/CopY family transcriptional regulator [Thermoanaerobaculia bacterium]